MKGGSDTIGIETKDSILSNGTSISKLLKSGAMGPENEIVSLRLLIAALRMKVRLLSSGSLGCLINGLSKFVR